MSDIYFLTNGKIYTVKNGISYPLRSEAVERYIQNVKDIEQRQEWKSSGAGARFMGATQIGAAQQQGSSDNVYATVESISATDQNRLIYAASLENSSGIYTKNLKNEDTAEGFIIRQSNTRIFHIDYEPRERLIVSSVSDGPRGRHIALIREDHSDFTIITEGDTLETTPSFSRKNPHIIYYSSVGYYVEQRKGKIHFGTYCINRLDIHSGELTEVISDTEYDYIRPKETAEGRLYCIRRYKEKPKVYNPLVDIAMIPVRFLSAIFGWMNFFTQRYTGNTLTRNRSGGANPAKYQDKSDEALFIEGNLIRVEQTLKENTQQGDKYPGIVPKSWELGCISEDGRFEPLKKGVLDYAFDGDDIIYSNGRFLIRLQSDGEESVICEANTATCITVLSTNPEKQTPHENAAHSS